MKKIVVLLSVFALLLSGCTQSNIVKNQGKLDPDMETKDDIEINWSQVWEDLDAQFIDPELYPFSESVNCNVVDEGKRIEFFLLVQPGTTKEQASSYATEVLKGFNDSIVTQDFSYESSGEESYGSYLAQYEIYVMVAPYDSKQHEETWIMEDTIQPGEAYRPAGQTE